MLGLRPIFRAYPALRETQNNDLAVWQGGLQDDITRTCLQICSGGGHNDSRLDGIVGAGNLATDRGQHDASGRRRRRSLYRCLSRAGGSRPRHLPQPIPREQQEPGRFAGGKVWRTHDVGQDLAAGRHPGILDQQGSHGGRFPSSHITAALAGKATGEFDYLQDPENAAEKHLHTPLVEIYAPLFRTGTQEIIAVGEVYTDGRELAADLASIRLTSAGIVGAVTAPMMLILFLMVRGASNLVNGYQSTLIQNMVEAKRLAAQNDRLRRLADDARLEAAVSNENLLARIGQDLHDGPIQLVSLLMLKVTDPSATRLSEIRRSCAHDPAIEPLTRRILAELRNISTGLVLPELEGLTPSEVIQLAVQNHEEATGTKVSRQFGDLPRPRAASNHVPVPDRPGRIEQRLPSWKIHWAAR